MIEGVALVTGIGLIAGLIGVALGILIARPLGRWAERDGEQDEVADDERA